jgi:hypothetical protein
VIVGFFSLGGDVLLDVCSLLCCSLAYPCEIVSSSGLYLLGSLLQSPHLLDQLPCLGGTGLEPVTPCLQGVSVCGRLPRDHDRLRGKRTS